MDVFVVKVCLFWSILKFTIPWSFEHDAVNQVRRLYETRDSFSSKSDFSVMGEQWENNRVNTSDSFAQSSFA